ncbi:MAG TPA: MarR family transcriptional regulator [Candidatus Limnocylindrales bacterium]
MSLSADVIDAVELLAIVFGALTASAFASESPDLTFLQWRVLLLAVRSPSPPSVSGLASNLNVAMPSASRMVARMRRRGLINLEADPRDGRMRRVVATPAGRELYERIATRRRALIAGALSRHALPASFASSVHEIADLLTAPTRH